MSVLVRGLSRAYVAAPVAPANELFQATHWAVDLDAGLTWKSLGIMAADPPLVEDLSHLHRLQRRGVRIGTVEQATYERTFSGVVIAYCPDSAMLMAAEQIPGAQGLVALAQDIAAPIPWVAATDPQHLGGHILSPARTIESPFLVPTSPLQPSA